MFKKELAEKWHCPKKVIDDMCKEGKINYIYIRTEKNQKAIDIPTEEVLKLERFYDIPKDPLSFEELGISANELSRLRQSGKIKNFASLTRRIKIYSKSEFEELARKEIEAKKKRFKNFV